MGGGWEGAVQKHFMLCSLKVDEKVYVLREESVRFGKLADQTLNRYFD